MTNAWVICFHVHLFTFHHGVREEFWCRGYDQDDNGCLDMQDSSKANPPRMGRNGKHQSVILLDILFLESWYQNCVCCGSGSIVNFESCVFEYLSCFNAWRFSRASLDFEDIVKILIWVGNSGKDWRSSTLLLNSTEAWWPNVWGNGRVYRTPVRAANGCKMGLKLLLKIVFEKGPIEKEIRSSNLQCSGDMLVFRGSWIFLLVTQSKDKIVYNSKTSFLVLRRYLGNS